jgi:hypothetical protein
VLSVTASGTFNEQRQEALHGRVTVATRLALDGRLDYVTVQFPKPRAHAAVLELSLR